MITFQVPARPAPAPAVDGDPGDEDVPLDFSRVRCTIAGSWFSVHPRLLGLHWEFVRDVNDGHDDTNGEWKLLYEDGSPATAEELELVRGKFTPA